MGLPIRPATLALLCVANLVVLLFGLVLLIDWIRNWRHVKAYWVYGLGAGLAWLGLTLLGVATWVLSALPMSHGLLPPGEQSGAVPGQGGPEGLAALLLGLFLIVLGLLIALISATSLGGTTMLGMHYAAVLGHPSFPLLQRLYNPRPSAATQAGLGLAEPGDATPMLAPLLPQGEAAAQAVVASPATKPLARCAWAVSTLAVVGAAIGYSALLFRLTSPRLSEVLAGLPGYNPEQAYTLTPAVLLTLLVAALSEEVVYRLGIQGFLARYLNAQGQRYWIPVVLAALLWTLQHAGAVEPGWVKLAQVFPIGVLLGWLYRRQGIESCIVAHALFNLGMAPLAPFLIRP
jgi:membrane protease YdiL (CAAX protease family)